MRISPNETKSMEMKYNVNDDGKIEMTGITDFNMKTREGIIQNAMTITHPQMTITTSPESDNVCSFV